MSKFLDQIYFGNSGLDYCWLIGAILVGLVFQKYLSKLLSNLIFKIVSKQTSDISNEELYALLHKPLSRFIMLIIIYIASSHIDFPTEWNLASEDEFGVRMILAKSYQFALIITIAWIALRVLEFFMLLLTRKADKTDGKQDDQIIAFVREILRIVLIIITAFIILGNVFEIEMGPLLAGLGVGGLALALAAKESLENLLSSFTIFFDKPFVMGDFVKVGDVYGTVEKVGFRSTRLRTPEKSYVTIPNKKMIDAELDNLSLRTFRRVRQTIGLLYGTPSESIQAIVSDIQKLIDDHKNTNQDGLVRFTEFGASSLDIMVNYYVDTMDWSVYLDVKQEINYKIMEIVEKHKSDFAFPTQTIHLEKSDS
ncbi:MAG: mechanosensitive ion channel family protein [Flavobacteriales bacterium]|nr:mechanosensitive ion channel family protein [Flavobacteriales bacterium]